MLHSDLSREAVAGKSILRRCYLLFRVTGAFEGRSGRDPLSRARLGSSGIGIVRGRQLPAVLALTHSWWSLRETVLPFLVPLMPLLGALPLALAAAWIASRWLKTRGTSAELQGEMAALREELETLRQGQAELQERFDFAERLLIQLREPARKSLEAPPHPGDWTPGDGRHGGRPGA